MNPDPRASLPGILTPHQIADAPELALLQALDEVLLLVPRALVAAHPPLDDSEAPFCAGETSRTTGHANDIIVTAYKLLRRVRTYRRAVTLARDQRLRVDPEIPF